MPLRLRGLCELFILFCFHSVFKGCSVFLRCFALRRGLLSGLFRTIFAFRNGLFSGLFHFLELFAFWTTILLESVCLLGHSAFRNRLLSGLFHFLELFAF